MNVVTKQYSFTSKLFKYFLSEDGLLTLHNCCVSFSLDDLKLESKIQLPNPEFSGYHCIKYQFQAKMICFENLYNYKIK